jgi:TPR repeat protein
VQSFNLFARNGNFATALKEFKPLAEQGHIGDQSSLGTLYSIGKGVPQDYTEAVKWYTLAAEKSNANAQSGLGFMDSSGKGVPQDYAFAHTWFNIAAANGYYKAIKIEILLRPR